MLEIKNLTKIYKTKGGVNVRALNDASINFPETGMVFLLGKSGSGKSTLLNVCGGLDNPTSGELIIKGKSSRDFTQSDFDSYRNTFVGFIFQEYNILNEFTVEDNIALALELQGKPKDKKSIDELLEKVDLKEYGNRRPNTLSGGQKQRIAIARALIKNPEIIMADEPTGALDSATGKQVFDTLKKLSKDTLVMVVSHDREFAENYADRIIELKDGKVISDISKTSEKENVLTSNISVIGDTLCIKQGSNLTDKDFNSIKSFLSDTNSDIIIAKSKEDVRKIKTITKINNNGEKEVFKDTMKEDIKLKHYEKEDSNFIKSRLPIRHAFKIGVSSLKNKPIRLFFTVLLCTSAFILFGLLSTMIYYDSEATFKQTLRDSNYSLMKLDKEFLITEYYFENGKEKEGYSYNDKATFSDNDKNSYTDKYGNKVFGGVSIDGTFAVQGIPSSYWINKISTMAYLEEDNPLRNEIKGNYPKKNDEIVLTSYTVSVILNSKMYDVETNKLIELKSIEEMIGKKININGQTYKVTGIFDNGEIDLKYNELLNSKDDNSLLTDFTNYLQDNLHLVAFTTKTRLEEISDNYYTPWIEGDFAGKAISIALKENNDYKFQGWSNALYTGYSKNNVEIIKLKEFGTLSNSEIVVSRALFGEVVARYYSAKLSDNWSEGLSEKYKLAIQVQYGYEEVYNSSNDSYQTVDLTNDELKQKTQELINLFKKENSSLLIGIKLFDEVNAIEVGELIEAKIVGIRLDNEDYGQYKVLFNDIYADTLWNNQKENMDGIYISKTNYVKNGTYTSIFLPFDNSEENINDLYQIYANEEYGKNDAIDIVGTSVIRSLENMEAMIDSLSQVLLYMGIALAVFAILLFFNFISVSISQKTKEIGILRAVGARSSDVFKIFFSESFVVTIICVILSIIGSNVVCRVLNSTLANSIGVSVFVFGLTSLIILIIIALITALISTFLPVYKAAHKKPVDSIRTV